MVSGRSILVLNRNYINNDKRSLDNLDFSEYIFDKNFIPLISKLKLSSNNIYFILPPPYGKDLEFNSLLKNEEYKVSMESYKKKYKYIKTIASKLNVNLIDPLDTLSTDGYFYPVSNDGRLKYKDGYHMRPWFVLSFVDYIK